MGAPVTLTSGASQQEVGTTASPLVVTGVSPSGTQDVNLKQVGGTTVVAGNGVTGAGSQRVTIASDNTAFTVKVQNVSTVGYETVAASQTAQVLGGAGATGDFLVGLLVIPATVSPGAISILDNATSISVFAGGANSVSNLVPFFIPIGANSASGPWKVTTGANVSVVAIGNFT